jgi:hypothetical protein
MVALRREGWTGMQPSRKARETQREERKPGGREFRTVELGDKRLEQRLKRVAADLAARPQAPI